MKRFPVPLRAHRGFTVIELVLVVLIGAVLAVISIPALRDTVRTTRQNSAAGLLVSDLNQARGEAIKRNGRVLICVRDAAGTACGGGTDWAVGWLVCSDANADNACDAGTADNPNPQVVRPALDPTLTLVASAAVIRFNANSSQGTGGAAATLTLGGTWSGAPNRVLTIAGTGNITRQ